MNHLNENIGRIIFAKNHNNFFYPSPIVMETKAKLNKCDLIKLKSFCIADEIVDKTKRIGEGIA